MRRLGSTIIHLFDGTKDGLHDDTGDLVRVGVGSGAAILKVTVALGSALTRDTDGRATVGDAPCELVDGTGFVAASKTELVALAIDEDVCREQWSVRQEMADQLLCRWSVA